MTEKSIWLALILLAALGPPAAGQEPEFVAPWLKLVDADDQVIAPVVATVKHSFFGQVPLIRLEVSGRPAFLMAFAQGATDDLANVLAPPDFEAFREIYYSGPDCTGSAFILPADLGTFDSMLGWGYGVGRCLSDPAKACIFESDLATPPAWTFIMSSSPLVTARLLGRPIDCQSVRPVEFFFAATEVKTISNPQPWRFE